MSNTEHLKQGIDPAFKRCLTVKEFRHRYGWGHTKAHSFISSGQLKSFKLGGKRLIRVEDAEAFLAAAITASQ